MSWRDSLRPASFRGVPFYVDVSQYTGGRRVTFHEYPDRDLPYPEDMGKVGNNFKIEGHILGEDYFQIRKSLIEACETPGPGELIHPYFGNKFVQCGAISIDEDTKEGGIAKVSFQFYEAGDNRFPNPADYKQGLLESAKDVASDAGKGKFDRLFSIAKMPGHVVESARAKVFAATTAFQAATSGVVSTIEGLADLAYSIRNLKAEVNDLLQSPAKLSQRLKDTIALLEDAIETPRGRLKAVETLVVFGANEAPGPKTTPIRTQESVNAEEFNAFIQREALVRSIYLATDVEFTSLEEATAQRESLREALEEQIIKSGGDDDLFQALEDLQAQLVRAIPDVDSEIPSVKEIQTTDVIPSLVLAYDLFENPDTEADIISRNNISHPGFIPANSILEVVNAS